MRLHFEFDEREAAQTFYEVARELYRAVDPARLQALAPPERLLEAADACWMCSIYDDRGRSVVYLELDDELRAVAEDLEDGLRGLCAALGVQPADSGTAEQRAFHEEDAMTWPAEAPRAYVTASDGAHRYELIVAPPPEDAEDFLARTLAPSQMVACARYWHELGRVPYTGMEMLVFDDTADGEESGRDFEHIASRLRGDGRATATRITLRTHSSDRPDLDRHAEALFIDTLATALGLAPESAPLPFTVHDICLTSPMGFRVVFRCDRELSPAQEEALTSSFGASVLGRFVERLFENLLETRPVVLLARDDMHGDRDVEDVFEEAPQEPAELVTLSAALQLAGSPLSAVKVNKLLLEHGVLEELKVRGSKTARKVFADDQSVFGRNVQRSHRKHDIEARYYVQPFQALLDEIG